MRGGDARSAANAYTAALDIDPTLRAALGNRAAACLRLGLAEAAARDCTTAMMLLPAPRLQPAPPLPPVSLPALALHSDSESESKSGPRKPVEGGPTAPTPELLWEREALERSQRAADCLESLLDGVTEAEGDGDGGYTGGSIGLRRPGSLGPGAVESERLGVMKLLARRGLAHCKCGDFGRAQADFASAAQVAGTCESEDARERNSSLAEDAARMGVLAECAICKGDGDASLRGGSPSEAEASYAAAL